MHTHPVQVYYEDTDFSGIVYHANYLKYFERAREHMFGVDALVRLYNDDGIGFVVYRAELKFREGAVHGDRLEVRTTVQLESPYRLVFQQNIYRHGAERPLVEGTVELVCVDRKQKLVALPTSICEQLVQNGQT